MQSKLEWFKRDCEEILLTVFFPIMQGNMYPKLIVFGPIMAFYVLVLQTTSPQNNVNT